MKLQQFNGLFLVGNKIFTQKDFVFKYGNLQKYIIRTGKIR